MKSFKRFFVFFLLIISLFSLTLNVNAQDNINLGFAQDLDTKYLKLEPGTTYKNKFTVWNTKAETTTFYIYISGFKPVEDYPGTAIPLTPEEDDKNPYSASNWFSMDIDQIELVPQKNVDLEYTITVPEDIALGEYVTKIFLSTQNPDDVEEDPAEASVAYSNLATGPDFLIQIGDPDNLVEELDLLRFTSDKAFYEIPYVAFLTEIENIGNTHVTPVGDIIVFNFMDEEVARFPVNPSKASTLRGVTSSYRTEWKSTRQILNEDNKLIIGPMHAELVSTYKTVNPGFYPILSETSFWIVPWKILLAIIAAVILISIGLKVRKNGNKKSNEKKAE